MTSEADKRCPQLTESESHDAISADDVAWVVEESFRTELLRQMPVFGIHVSTVQVHHRLDYSHIQRHNTATADTF